MSQFKKRPLESPSADSTLSPLHKDGGKWNARINSARSDSERERFELSRRSSRLSAFEAGAFNHSTTSPRSARDEEVTQLAGRFLFENAPDHLHSVVNRRRTEHIDYRAGGTAFRVACPID